MSEDLSAILRIFGLRKYEAAIYTSLLRKGAGTANDIAERSSVPLPRIYTIIKALEKKGYVRRMAISPALYAASHPGHILRADLSILRQKLENTLLDVEQEYETSAAEKVSDRFAVTTTPGERGFVSAAIGLLSESQKEVVAILHDYGWCLEESVLKILKQKKREKLKMMLIGKDQSDSLENLDILRVSSGALVRSVSPASLGVSFMVRDKSDMMMTFQSTKVNESDGNTTVLVSHPQMAAMFRNLFDEIWMGASERGVE